MDDLISRQAAIEAICKVCQLVENYKKCDGYPETSMWCDELVALRAVPSAQPECKTGRWIDHQRGRWIYAQCSECGTVHDVKSNFCPNCGAKMEVDDGQTNN